MGIERYIAIAGVGLYIMFAAEINVLFNFLQDPFHDIEPTPKLLQFISIGIAPASILVAVAFILSRRYGSKSIGSMIMGGGAVLIVGMIIAQTLLEKVDPKFLEPAILATPIVFAAIGVPVIIIGAILFRNTKPRRQSSQNYSSWTQSDD